MALKKKLSKEEFEKKSKDIQSEYVEEADGSYRLDVEGEEDTGNLKRAKDREKQMRHDAEKKLKEAQDQLDALGTDDARKKGDIELLEKQWAQKASESNKQYEARIAKLTEHATKTLVDNVALQIANKISTAPNLILPHIKARLKADMDGDAPTTKVLGADGNVSEMSLDQLSAEFVANKDFSAIITGSKASGSAGKPSKPAGGAANPDNKPADLSRMSTAELTAHMMELKANKEA